MVEQSSGLQDALGELLKEEHAKEGRKKKPVFKVPVENGLHLTDAGRIARL